MAGVLRVGARDDPGCAACRSWPVGRLRFGGKRVLSAHPRQCAISLPTRTTATHQKTATDSWSQSESQSRDERDLQGSRDPSQLWCGAVARLLCGFAGQRDETRDGASDIGTQDCGHCFDTLEEGGTFRRRTTEAASRLSVAQNSGDLPGCVINGRCDCFRCSHWGNT